MCCKIKPSFSSYWHDLSLSYYYQAKFDENNNHDDQSKVAQDDDWYLSRSDRQALTAVQYVAGIEV